MIDLKKGRSDPSQMEIFFFIYYLLYIYKDPPLYIYILLFLKKKCILCNLPVAVDDGIESQAVFPR